MTPSCKQRPARRHIAGLATAASPGFIAVTGAYCSTTISMTSKPSDALAPCGTR
jgi:hypothetical protein